MLNNFNSVYSLAQTLYGVALNPSEFEDIALNGWERIGNKRCKLHKYVTNTVNKEIELPCNLTSLESVHMQMLDSQMTTNQTIQNQVNTLYVEGYIESWKNNNNLLYDKGKLVKYRLEDNTLVFNKDYNNILIIYHGVITDEDGLPLLSDKEVNALATFVAYSEKYRTSLIKNDANVFQIAAALKADWLRNCNNARIPDKLTQNDMDTILDVKVRWDRKQYGKTFKPII